MKTAQQIFTEAFALVRNPATWAQRWSGVDKHDRLSGWSGDSTVKWCSLGALWRAEGEHNGPIAEEVEAALCKAAALANARFADFNDTHTHAEVVAAWERAGKAQGWLP
jgi:hypothetical protein